MNVTLSTDARHVAVVIPCRNEANYLPGLLQNLAQQTQQPAEIWLIDSDSDDDSPAIAEDHARRLHLNLHCLPNPSRNIPHALNTGIARAQSAIILRLDGHSLPALDYIERCAAGLTDEVAVIGGRWQIVAGATGIVAQAIALAVSNPFAAGDARYRTVRSGQPEWVETVPFGCFRKHTWEQVGGYNERLLANEDYEFYQRIRDGGGKILFDPAIVCTYFARSTWRRLAGQYWRYGWWKAQMLKQHPDSLRLRQIIPPLWVCVAVLLPLLALLLQQTVLLWVCAGLWAGYVAVGLLTTARNDVMRQTGLPIRLWLWLATFMSALVVHFSWGAGFWLGVLQTPGARAH
jgi:succinoglycan biosynthesis protein ExoA